jgi:hypothetical protein
VTTDENQVEPPFVACGVQHSGTEARRARAGRWVAKLEVTRELVRCEPRDVPPGRLPEGAVRGHHRWALEPDRDATVRVWCSRGRGGHWLEFSKFDAVAAAKRGGVIRAFPARRL